MDIKTGFDSLQKRYSELKTAGRLAFLLAARDQNIRYRATSGGFITALQMKLLASTSVDSVICYRFNQEQTVYEPFVAKLLSEFRPTSSIYHEINLFRFLSDNADILGQKTCITCLPCQIVPIRKLMKRKNFDAIIIALTCSNTLTLEATRFLCKKLHINNSDILDIQYRGNGWPSGIQILTKEGKFFIPNNNSIWRNIFHSGVFTPPICFHCPAPIIEDADFIVADPWLPGFMEKDRIGTTVVLPLTETAEELMKTMINCNTVDMLGTITIDQFFRMQRNTLLKKIILNTEVKLFEKVRQLIQSQLYKQFYTYIMRPHRRYYELLIDRRLQKLLIRERDNIDKEFLKILR